MRSFDVAIVGAGFSGTLTALQIGRAARIPASVLLADKDGVFGRGLAYRKTTEPHLLNVPAKKMGAFPDDTNNFVARQALSDPDSFQLRTLYGDYLQGLLATAARDMSRLEQSATEITDVEIADGGFVVSTATGEPFFATIVILALGNFQPSHYVRDSLGPDGGPFYVDDPLDGATLDSVVSHASDVLVVGTGLTALDCMTSLASRISGVIHVTSRRGLLAQAHAATELPVTEPPELRECETALSVLRAVRAAIREQSGRGIDWRSVIDSLRPLTPTVWQRLPVRERKRFLRHLRPFWETRRHRCAPAQRALIDDLVAAGRIRRHRGRIVRAQAGADGLQVTMFDRGQQTQVDIVVSHVLNCTGSETDYARVDSKLVRNLLRRGLIAVDETRLGLAATADGCVRSRTGDVVPNLFAIGSPLKGILYETTAVPELRKQAHDLGDRCAAILEKNLDVA